MNKYFLFFLFSLQIVAKDISAQSPWFWAREGASSIYNSEGWSVTSDPVGNAYVTGLFSSSTITFGSITLTNANPSQQSLFLTKYDVSGNVLWAKTISGTTKSEGLCVKTDLFGNVFLSGYFSGNIGASVTFDTITRIYPTSFWNIYLAKFNSSGNILWLQSEGVYAGNVGRSIATDDLGNVYLAGNFWDATISFDTVSVSNTTSWNAAFLVKYSPSGNALWAKCEGSNNQTAGRSISVDKLGNIYFTGDFRGSNIVFGADTLFNTAVGFEDVFIVKYTSAGNTVWAKKFGGTTADISAAISADKFGNIYLTGNYYSPTITIGTSTFSNAGGSDLFLTKMDSSGNVIWAKATGGINNDGGYSLLPDNSGNVYFVGGFYIPSPASFPYSISFGSTIVSAPAGTSDPAFICKFNAAGNCTSSTTLLSGGDDVLAIAADTAFQNFYVGGDATIRPYYLGPDTLNSGNSPEYIFIAKWNPNAGLYSFTSTNPGVSCSSTCTGIASCNASGGVLPYSYHWFPGGQTTQNIAGLCAGTYTCIVTDSLGVTSSSNIYVAYNPPNPTFITTITEPSCFGLCNGSIILTITGGVAPFSYFGGGTSLCAGTYPVSVTSSNGCSVSQNIILSQPAPLTVVANPTPASCGTCCDGSAYVTPGGGTPGYTYLWMPGGFTNNLYAGLCAGTYTCCVTDTNGCQTCQSTTISFSTGINETENSESIFVYPNPFGENTTFMIQSDKLNETYSFELTDVLGKKVKSMNGISDRQFQISRNGLENGVYFYKIYSSESIISVGKLIVE